MVNVMSVGNITVNILDLMDCKKDLFGAYKSYSLSHEGSFYKQKTILGYPFYTRVDSHVIVSLPIIGNVFLKAGATFRCCGITINA